VKKAFLKELGKKQIQKKTGALKWGGDRRDDGICSNRKPATNEKSNAEKEERYAVI